MAARTFIWVVTISQFPDRRAKKNPAPHSQILASPASQGAVKSWIPSRYLSFSRFPHRNLVKSCIPKIPFQTLLEGPGKLLGYRAMNQQLRTEHNVQVPCHLVYNVMAELDPEGLEARNLQRKKKKVKGHFTSDGPLWVVSLDGHDKLCGYQNSTFPLGVYTSIDTFSRKILFLFVCYSNLNPLVIGKMYLRYLFESQMLPRNLRFDRGTETGKMVTIHVFLSNQHGMNKALCFRIDLIKSLSW